MLTISATVFFPIFAYMNSIRTFLYTISRVIKAWMKITFALVIITLVSCAVQTPISGGEKDIAAPVITGSSPKNYTVGFKGERIIISFNEFITLKDIDKQVLISPPVEKMPKFKIRGKSLLIEFEEPLKPDATYNIFLGSAIADLTEGNTLTDFSFVFSTGDKLDSLEIEGKVHEAFDLQPPKAALAMLYDGTNDSLPYLSRPLYVSRVNASGSFKLGNLREGRFKMIVLEDLNGNYLYDRGEAIAFADSLVSAYRTEQPKHDSLGKDTVISKINGQVPELALFTESDSVQRMLKATLVAPNHLLLSFKFGVRHPKLSLPDQTTLKEWYLVESNTTGDTLNFWLKNITSDSLRFVVSDGNKIIDTSNVSLEYKTKENRKGQHEGVAAKLQVRSNVSRQGNFPLNTKFVLVTGNPLLTANFKSVKLIEGVDTLFPGASFSDSLNRRIAINRTLLEDKPYKIIIPDSVFKDIYGHSNDSVVINFRTRSLNDYGTLILNIKLAETRPYVIQLLTETGKLVREERIDTDKKLTFTYLFPGKYKLKAILDINRNGKWDTGNYLGHLQPELVINYPTVLDLRANWEQEEEWQLNAAKP
jgi:hypothetical protein